MTIGGSTNAILHLTALAYEADLDINVMELFDEFSKSTPTIAKVNPAGKNDMESFWRAGGIPRVMKNLKSVLNMDVMTCTAKKMSENVSEFSFIFPENPVVNNGSATFFHVAGSPSSVTFLYTTMPLLPLE